MLTDFQKDNPDSKKLTDSQIAEKIQKISDNFFIGQLFTAFDQVNLNNTSPMTIDDLFLALKIAKEFGGLSNFLNDDKSGYKKSNFRNLPEDIKKHFPSLNDTEISNKLKLYQKFSAEFQKLNQGLVYSMRTTANQTPLRLTFFPDSAIERLKGYNEGNKDHAINFAKKTKTEREQIR
jgi:hypothetical protein